ncbi:MAG TPA: lysylphosphatidylglycerol synthase domain-containing protein [Gemmatimonadales bacterium]|nr:lysylphosphatidylglycerol synthase domain-containing protein [Gemmatimonadales bacterium]
MRSRFWRILQWAFAVAIVGFAATRLAGEWTRLREQPVVWELRPWYLVASVLVVWLMYAVLIQAWRAMLAGWGDHLPPVTAARIWTVSSLGKYIPGKLWAIAGMALMAQRAGVRPWTATASAVVLQALAIGTGAAVVGGAGVQSLESRYPWVPLALRGLVMLSLLGVALLLWPPFVRRLLRLVRIDVEKASPGAGPVLGGALANLAAWCGYGVAFWLLAHGLFAVGALTPGLAITTFAASYVAGLLFLPAPGGIGIRESVVIIILGSAIGEASALALAIASRVLLTITEFGAAAPFLLAGERTGGDD